VKLYIWHNTSSNAVTDSFTKLAQWIDTTGTRPWMSGLDKYRLEEIEVSCCSSMSICRVYQSYWEY
jgi:hypothetical protein